MQTYIDPLITVGILILNALFSSVLATLATVPWGPLFPFKPFNCETCLTFWFTLGLGLVWSWFLSDTDAGFAVTAAFSFVLSIVNFIYVKSKFKINE